MDIKELENFNLADAVKFHDELNPALWTDKGRLDPEVHERLMDIAKDFMAYLGLSSLKVEDITISGSNAAYSYTPHSDLDLHILVDFDKLPDDEVYRELFNAKKTIYNDTHDIKVHGVPVELYVQDSNQPHHSLGEYSILKKDWIKMPIKRRANFDQSATRAKYEKLGELIELAIKTRSLKRVDKALDIVKRYRKAGLEKTGEFGPENLAFKAIRKQGLFKELWDLKNELRSEELSLEDYHPNAKPRGPEFPPTMPAGTVKVDVSDVYDWYKLGQHISDLGGLGKHDFGKGPPSTILSFGDEDTEHKYIDNLMKTGLTTTDIDPKGHEPKKGQKTDPTYNVKEGGAETSWSDGTEKITLQDILGLTKHIKQINLPIDDNLKSKLLHWDGNPEEIERINQVTVSNQFPILVMVDEQGQIDWILDGNHRLHKAIKSQAKTIPAKLIKPSDLNDKAKRVFHIKVGEGRRSRDDYKQKYDDLPTLIDAWMNDLNRYFRNQVAYSYGEDENTLVAKVRGQIVSVFDKKTKKSKMMIESASGYIPSESEKNDPRFKTALTVDIKPDTMRKDAKKFGNKLSRAGIPPKLNTNGKI